jgi:PPP family 3-phenylpropionic acid transporter
MSPGIAYTADRRGTRRGTIVVLSAVAAITAATLELTSGFWSLFAVFAVFGLVWTPVMPLTDAYVMDGVRAYGADYGRIRLWGSLAFIAATVICGMLLDAFGSSAALYFFIAALAASFVVALGLPPVGDGGEQGQGPREWHFLADAKELITLPIALFFLAGALVQAGHAVYYAFGTLHWQALGYSTTLIGILWTLGVIAEIALFAFARPALARLGSQGLLALAALAVVVRWTAMGFDPPLWMLVALQALHAFTFGAAHLAVIFFIGERVRPRLSATAQSLFYGLSSLVMGAVTAGAGFAYGVLAGKAYLAMVLFGIAALGVMALAKTLSRPAAGQG